MDSLKFHNIKLEKANSGYPKITTLFRLLELFIFFFIISRFSIPFPFSFNLSAEYLRGIALTIISPQFVFVLGNAIIIALFFISGSTQFSTKNGAKSSDFYDKYVEKCEKNQQSWIKEEKKTSNEPPQTQLSLITKKPIEIRKTVCSVSSNERIKMRKSSSETNLRRKVNGDERHRELRRSMTVAGKKDEMSGDEFRLKVEAFIARQQRLLREEEEFSAAVVSFET